MAERWHVGKEIPLALILAICTSVASGIWYASATSARITMIEETIKGNSTVREDIVQLREQVRNVERLLTRMETVLDRRSDIEKTDRLGAVQ